MASVGLSQRVYLAVLRQLARKVGMDPGVFTPDNTTARVLVSQLEVEVRVHDASGIRFDSSDVTGSLRGLVLRVRASTLDVESLTLTVPAHVFAGAGGTGTPPVPPSLVIPPRKRTYADTDTEDGPQMMRAIVDGVVARVVFRVGTVTLHCLGVGTLTLTRVEWTEGGTLTVQSVKLAGPGTGPGSVSNTADAGSCNYRRDTNHLHVDTLQVQDAVGFAGMMGMLGALGVGGGGGGSTDSDDEMGAGITGKGTVEYDGEVFYDAREADDADAGDNGAEGVPSPGFTASCSVLTVVHRASASVLVGHEVRYASGRVQCAHTKASGAGWVCTAASLELLLSDAWSLVVRDFAGSVGEDGDVSGDVSDAASLRLPGLTRVELAWDKRKPRTRDGRRTGTNTTTMTATATLGAPHLLWRGEDLVDAEAPVHVQYTSSDHTLAVEGLAVLGWRVVAHADAIAAWWNGREEARTTDPTEPPSAPASASVFAIRVQGLRVAFERPEARFAAIVDGNFTVTVEPPCVRCRVHCVTGTVLDEEVPHDVFALCDLTVLYRPGAITIRADTDEDPVLVALDAVVVAAAMLLHSPWASGAAEDCTSAAHTDPGGPGPVVAGVDMSDVVQDWFATRPGAGAGVGASASAAAAMAAAGAPTPAPGAMMDARVPSTMVPALTVTLRRMVVTVRVGDCMIVRGVLVASLRTYPDTTLDAQGWRQGPVLMVEAHLVEVCEVGEACPVVVAKVGTAALCSVTATPYLGPANRRPVRTFVVQGQEPSLDPGFAPADAVGGAAVDVSVLWVAPPPRFHVSEPLITVSVNQTVGVTMRGEALLQGLLRYLAEVDANLEGAVLPPSGPCKGLVIQPVKADVTWQGTLINIEHYRVVLPSVTVKDASLQDTGARVLDAYGKAVAGTKLALLRAVNAPLLPIRTVRSMYGKVRRGHHKAAAAEGCYALARVCGAAATALGTLDTPDTQTTRTEQARNSTVSSHKSAEFKTAAKTLKAYVRGAADPMRHAQTLPELAARVPALVVRPLIGVIKAARHFLRGVGGSLE